MPRLGLRPGTPPGGEGGYEEAQGKLPVPRAMSLEVEKKKTKKQDSGPEGPG